MTTYLSMNGTSDYITLPSMTISQIIATISITRRTDINRFLWDLRPGIGFAYLIQQTNGTDSIGKGTVTVNGTGVSGGTTFIPNNTKCTIVHNIGVGTSSPFIFASDASAGNIQGSIYDLKLYNGSTLVAHYDMSTGTVIDQSGNGYNGTLHGGTWLDDGTGSSTGTTYIGSGTATGQSNLTSNETLILSEHGTITGKSNLTSNETQILSASGTITGRSNLSSAETFTSVGSSGSILSASGTVTGQSLLQSRETMIYASNGQITGQSRLTSNDRLIMPESGTIQGQSRLSSGEIYVYSERGTIQGKSSLISYETLSLSAGGVITGKSNLESLETMLMMASGTVTGESNLLSHETFQSVLRVIRTITLQGDRQLHFVIQASRQLHITLQGSRQLHITLKGGVDMAVNNETQEIYQGQSAIIDIPNITDDNNTLNLSACTAITFVAKRGGNVISKDLTNGVTAVDSSTLKIELDPIDTNLPYGLYSYQIWCTDDQGEVTPLSTGTLNLITSMVTQ